MKVSLAIREVMKNQEIGVNKLSNRLNKKQNVISERLRQDNISIVKLNEILRVLDYKLVIIPRDASIPKDGFEIE